MPVPAAELAIAQLRDRLSALESLAATTGVDAVIVTPGADLRYLLGWSVGSHERLTALVLQPDETARMLIPVLERPGWVGTPLEALDIAIDTWLDGEDPYQILAATLAPRARLLAIDERMPAVHALHLQRAVPGAELRLATTTLGALRIRKSATERQALREVAAANDRVHLRMGEWLRAGRSENAVAADIAAALVADGHAAADFVIVGSGPNGASPHHVASDRIVQPGDAVVVDIGGPAPTGYFSDCTRTYLVAGGEPDPQLRDVYDVVRAAQAAGVAAVAAGVPAASVDAAARAVIEQAGYGDYFVTRTGHGIGLEVHEPPFLVTGNATALEPGMAFSVEPGIYLPGRFGVRIEDIVIVTEDGPLRCNNAPTELVVVG